MDQQLQHLFRYKKEDSKYYTKLDRPLSFNEYFDIIKNNITYFNGKNILHWKDKYDYYLEIFKTYKKEKVTLSFLNIWSKNSINIKYYLERGWGIEESRKLLKERQGTNSHKYISKKYNISEEDAKDITSERCIKAKNTLIESGKYEETCYKKGNSNRVEFYLDKVNPDTNNFYTEIEAKDKIYKKQSIGFKSFWQDVHNGKKQYFGNNTIEYYLKKGLPLLEAYKALSERQSTFSLDICIEKYGKKKGLEVFNKRQLKWQNTLNNKSDEEKLDILNRKLKGFKKKFYSNSSIIFFDKLIELCKLGNIELEPYYKNDEYFIYDNKNKKINYYDFTIKDLNLIFEYNGSHIHSNEKISKEKQNKWKHLYNKKSFNEILDIDNKKIKLAKDNDFNVHIIWDTDCVYEKLKEALNIIKKAYKNKK